MQEACNVIKQESLAQVFSFEFCEISKNTFFTEHLRTEAAICSVLAFHINNHWLQSFYFN